MATLIYAPADAALAQRLRKDIDQAGISSQNIVVILFSPHALQDQQVQQALIKALDNRQHIVPVKASPVDLPHYIDHLPVVDLSETYDAQAVIDEVKRLASPDAPPPIIALTPSLQKQNRRFALALSLVAAFMFVVAVLGLLAGTLLPPEDEFAGVETQIYLTSRVYIDAALPRSTEQAAEFEATVQEMPTVARMQLIQTATAISAGVEASFIPRSTQEATNFPVTLRAVSTLVHENLLELVTQAAATAVVVTPTP